jgi:hypothetical protein
MRPVERWTDEEIAMLRDVARGEYRTGEEAYRAYVKRGGKRSLQGVMAQAACQTGAAYRRYAQLLGREVRARRNAERKAIKIPRNAEWLTVNEARAFVGVTQWRLLGLFDKGEVARRPRKVSGRKARGREWEYSRKDLADWAARKESGSIEPISVQVARAVEGERVSRTGEPVSASAEHDPFLEVMTGLRAEIAAQFGTDRAHNKTLQLDIGRRLDVITRRLDTIAFYMESLVGALTSRPEAERDHAAADNA